MTKKMEGKLFEEPAVVIGVSSTEKANGLYRLYGGIVAVGRWKGELEHCIILPLALFESIVRYGTEHRAKPLLRAMQNEECIAVFYRLPRNPNILMCGMRTPPKLFARSWKFFVNEHTDKVVQCMPSFEAFADGLYLNDSLYTS